MKKKKSNKFVNFGQSNILFMGKTVDAQGTVEQFKETVREYGLKYGPEIVRALKLYLIFIEARKSGDSELLDSIRYISLKSDGSIDKKPKNGSSEKAQG